MKTSVSTSIYKDGLLRGILRAEISAVIQSTIARLYEHTSHMLRILTTISLCLLLIFGWFAAFRIPATLRVSNQSLSLAVAEIPASDGIFRGTITYGKDNIGLEVPYLVFTDPEGYVQTKALIFTSESDCDTARGTYPCTLIKDALSYYVGAGPVTTTGVVSAGSLVVSHLALNQS